MLICYCIVYTGGRGLRFQWDIKKPLYHTPGVDGRCTESVWMVPVRYPWMQE